MVAAFAGVAVVLAVAVVLTLRFVARPSVASRTARAGAALVGEVPGTAATRELLVRWRDRAAGARRSVAVPAAATAALAGLVFRQQVAVGVGAHPAWSDPLLAGLLGAFLGAIVAELHHLRPVPEGARAADLRPRLLEAHLPAAARRRSLGLGVVAAASVVAAMALTDVRVPALGLLGVALTGLVAVVERGVVGRRRPALPADLRAADDAVRRLAVHSIDHAGAGAVLLLTAWQLAPVYEAVALPGPAVGIATLTQVGALVLAIVWWWRSDPRRLLPDVSAVLAGTSATGVGGR